MHAERCPVCNGTGRVPSGFYYRVTGTWGSTGTQSEVCRSCGGRGYIEVHDELDHTTYEVPKTTA